MQVQKPKAKPIEHILDFVLLAIIITTIIAIAMIISPCFIEPIINRRRNNN